MELVATLELGLECELATQGMVSAPLTPDGDVRRGSDPLAKVENPKVLKDLLKAIHRRITSECESAATAVAPE